MAAETCWKRAQQTGKGLPPNADSSSGLTDAKTGDEFTQRSPLGGAEWFESRLRHATGFRMRRQLIGGQSCPAFPSQVHRDFFASLRF